MKILYKKDSKGKIRVLQMRVDGADIVLKSGLENGALVEHRKTAKAKNVGKSNATTPEQQAIAEIKSKYAAKLDEGYFPDRESAVTEVVILPMLAKDAKKEEAKIVFPCYVQPKLDGMRCIGNPEKMSSRTGKPIITMDHIQQSITTTGVIDFLDGELYAHGKSFQENMKLIKKYRAGQSEAVKYHVYDMLLPNASFIERNTLLKAIVENLEHVEIVPTYPVYDMDEVRKYHSLFLSQGYEGTMIRWGKEGYKINSRSSNLLKYKDFKDATFMVMDVVPSDAKPKQGVLCLVSGTQEFRASLKMSHAEREEVLENKDKYIGQTAEIRFFELTDGGLPRFPVCVGFRLDK